MPDFLVALVCVAGYKVDLVIDVEAIMILEASHCLDLVALYGKW